MRTEIFALLAALTFGAVLYSVSKGDPAAVPPPVTGTTTQPAATTTQPAIVPAQPVIVLTRARYEAVKTGMKPSEVEMLLGQPVYLKTESHKVLGIGPTTSKMVWRDAATSITVKFLDGKAVQKDFKTINQ
jgi:hypothetical protein